MDAFSARLGLSQGRIRPVWVEGTVGEFSFVLGDEAAGHVAELTLGDYAEVTQDVDVAGVDFVRAKLSLRVPPELPEGLAWEVSLRLWGYPYAAVRAGAGRVRVLEDMAANVAWIPGIVPVAIRLELVEAT